jgi:truncated hemoglobin YjbI
LYARIDRDPVLRPLFPGKTLHCAIAEFSAFLVQFLGGPAEHTQFRWWLSLDESHRRFQIGPRERSAWLKNMLAAIEETPLEESAREALRDFFRHASARLVNHGKPAESSGAVAHEELARRWDVQHAIDQAVAAIRAQDTDRAISRVADLALDDCMHCGMLAAMLRTRNDEFAQYVRAELRRAPQLTHTVHNDRTLLHAAVASGSVETVRLLLESGADPDARAHTPLYRLANEYTGPGGGQIVRLLVDAGANVNACDNVKRCTPLHMAARRDNVEVAAALLDCGAEIEARDSARETPLRRAVNCNMTRVAALLLARGADAHSIGSRGLTPLAAARSNAMRQVLKQRAL